MIQSPERPTSNKEPLWAESTNDDFEYLVTPPTDAATGKGTILPVEVPGFESGEIRCSWETTVARRKLDVRSIRVNLYRKGDEVATFDFALRRPSGSPGRWFLWNRLVEPEVEGTAIAAYGLRTAEQFIARLYKAKPSLPRRLTTSTRRPRLVNFLLKNGYEFNSKNERVTFEKFLSERTVALAGKEDNTDAYRAYTTRGELPSFWEVRLFLGRREQGRVLFSKDKLGDNASRHYEEQGRNEHVILKITDLKELDHMPGAVRIHLRKNVGGVQ